jgi:O-antigen ligase
MMFAPASVWDRLGGLSAATNAENLSEVDSEGSAEQRWQIWQTSFEIIADHPVTGVGWGAYAQANAAYAPMTGGGERRLGARDTHSTYLNVLAETGYPGFFIFCGLVFGTLLQTDRVRRRWKQMMPAAAMQLYFLELGLLGFMVSGIFGSYSRLSFLYLHLVLMWVVAKALESDARMITVSARTPLASARAR